MDDFISDKKTITPVKKLRAVIIFVWIASVSHDCCDAHDLKAEATPPKTEKTGVDTKRGIAEELWRSPLLQFIGISHTILVRDILPTHVAWEVEIYRPKIV